MTLNMNRQCYFFGLVKNVQFLVPKKFRAFGAIFFNPFIWQVERIYYVWGQNSAAGGKKLRVWECFCLIFNKKVTRHKNCTFLLREPLKNVQNCTFNVPKKNTASYMGESSDKFIGRLLYRHNDPDQYRVVGVRRPLIRFVSTTEEYVQESDEARVGLPGDLSISV